MDEAPNDVLPVQQLTFGASPDGSGGFRAVGSSLDFAAAFSGT